MDNPDLDNHTRHQNSHTGYSWMEEVYEHEAEPDYLAPLLLSNIPQIENGQIRYVITGGAVRQIMTPNYKTRDIDIITIDSKVHDVLWRVFKATYDAKFIQDLGDYFRVVSLPDDSKEFLKLYTMPIQTPWSDKPVQIATPSFLTLTGILPYGEYAERPKDKTCQMIVDLLPLIPSSQLTQASQLLGNLGAEIVDNVLQTYASVQSATAGVEKLKRLHELIRKQLKIVDDPMITNLMIMMRDPRYNPQQ